MLIVAIHGQDGICHEHGCDAGRDLTASILRCLMTHAPAGAVIGQLAADRFAVYLPDVSRAVGHSRNILTCLSACGSQHPLVTIHAGLARGHADADRPRELLHRAEAGARQARERNIYLHVFDNAKDAALLRQHRDAAQLAGDIAAGRIVVHYQRLVARSQPQRSVHFEALVRWPVADRLRLPGEFLPLAQGAKLMHALTQAVIKKVVEDLATWQAAGQEVCVAVNVPAHVLTESFLDELLGTLTAHGLARQQVHLEVTEHELVDGQARQALVRCRNLGLAVSVDDFGTGYSALGYVLDVPLTTIKIDRSLVQGVVGHPARRSLLQHCVDLAHQLGLQVVAEGIETHAEHDEVLALGADWLQGFYIHRPAPPDEALPR